LLRGPFWEERLSLHRIVPCLYFFYLFEPAPSVIGKIM
jgi:hypothetical protein